MSDEAVSTFDGVAGSFSEYDTTVRGQVRYQVTRRNLTPYLKQRSMSVLDIGGGSGPDAAWLVSLGHRVTIVEISEEQRLYAERRFDFFLCPEERALITMVAGDLSQLSTKPGNYDLVLCHGVAMYQPNPRAFIAEVCRWAKSKGIISVLEKGYYGAEARAVYNQQIDDLKELHESQKIINTLGVKVHAFTPDALETLIEMTGATVEQWGGIRVMSDQLHERAADIPKPILDIILEAEFSQGNNPGIRAQGQMLHFIARAS